MKAIRVHSVGGAEALHLDEVPMPRIEATRLLVRVGASGLNFADTAIRRGRYVMQPALPYIPGFEVAGTVVERGDGVDEARFPIGGRVAALTMTGGGYAEIASVRAAHAFPLPEALSFDEGAAFPLQGLTALHALTTSGRLVPGETVAIQAAAGGVGTLAIQLARQLGAGRTIALAGGPDKLRLTQELGADQAVNYLRENFPARVNEISAGRGADLILESLGGQTLERSFECLAVLGRVVTYGNASGTQPDLSTLWPRLRARSQSLIGFHLSAVLDRPAVFRQTMETLLGYLAAGQLRVVIGGRYPLAEAGAAQLALEGRRSVGKLILKP
jgi:NADPH:quinone reductase